MVSSTGTKSFLLLTVGMLLAGCQLFDSSTRAAAPRSPSVMSMWELYRHCQSSGDVETVLSAAKQLQQSAADTPVVPAPDVPKSLDRFVTKQPVRTTVDPKALLLHALCKQLGQSLSAGREQKPNSCSMPWCSVIGKRLYLLCRAAKVWIEELHRPGSSDPVIHPISTY